MEKINNFFASKKLGQNFLINEDICKKFIENINFTDVDCVVEIGPGMGAITKYLINKNIKYIGIEIDKRLFEYCTKNFKNENSEFINEDILNIDLKKITNKYKKTIVVTNAPYSISSLILIKFIKEELNTLYIMLQKEMVERILAVPKTKAYNNFTVLFNKYCHVTKLLNVSRNNFDPVPLVNSIIIKIDRNNEKYDIKFDNFIKLIFSQKRKTIVNNLICKYKKDNIIKILKENKLEEKARAEELNIKQIEGLFNSF